MIDTILHNAWLFLQIFLVVCLIWFFWQVIKVIIARRLGKMMTGPEQARALEEPDQPDTESVYFVISANTLEDLTTGVNEQLPKGVRPTGGIIFDGTRFHQAVLKDEAFASMQKLYVRFLKSFTTGRR